VAGLTSSGLAAKGVDRIMYPIIANKGKLMTTLDMYKPLGTFF